MQETKWQQTVEQARKFRSGQETNMSNLTEDMFNGAVPNADSLHLPDFQAQNMVRLNSIGMINYDVVKTATHCSYECNNLYRGNIGGSSSQLPCRLVWISILILVVKDCNYCLTVVFLIAIIATCEIISIWY